MSKAYAGWSSISWHAIWNGERWNRIDNPPLIHPAAAGVQFGQSVIEGMKASLSRKDSAVRVFRLKDHWERLNDSCNRLGLPTVSESFFKEAMSYLLLHKSQWEVPLNSDIIYIRPVVYSLEDHIFPKPGNRFGLSVFVAPVDSFLVEDDYFLCFQNKLSRSASNGLGNSKTASNYAPLFAVKEGVHCNCNNLLWVSGGKDDVIDEANTSNIFFVTQENTLITPSLNGRILPGITRRSIIELAVVLNIPLEERCLKAQEICQKISENKVTSCFLTSTGSGIQPVHKLRYEQETWDFSEHSLTRTLSEQYTKCFRGNSQFFSEWAEKIGFLENTDDTRKSTFA